MKKQILFSFLSIFYILNCQAAISLSTFNNFEDATTQGWIIGNATATNGPQNIATGGPTGVDDNYLQNQSDGVGTDGKFVFFNTTTDWTGNWTAAGVTYITFMVNNTGSTILKLRIAIDGTGGRWCSTLPITVNPSSGWIPISIPVSAGDFSSAGGGDITTTLSNVTTMRILSNASVSYVGENIVGQAGFDNIAADNAALPVELISFEGNILKSSIILNWLTATELNNDKFHIEHSTDGKNFQSIGEVQGNGTTLVQQKYTFMDEDVPSGIHYYRLKQLDFDGKFTLSPIISLNFNKKSKAISAFYPNPSPSGWVFMDYTTEHKGAIQISVFDVVGTLVSNETLQINEGSNRLQWNVSAYGKGVFFIKISDGQTLISRKIIVP